MYLFIVCVYIGKWGQKSDHPSMSYRFLWAIASGCGVLDSGLLKEHLFDSLIKFEEDILQSVSSWIELENILISEKPSHETQKKNNPTIASIREVEMWTNKNNRIHEIKRWITVSHLAVWWYLE